VTQEQPSEMIELLSRIATAQEEMSQSLQTLAAGLNTNLDAIGSTISDIEQAVGQIVNSTGPEVSA